MKEHIFEQKLMTDVYDITNLIEKFHSPITNEVVMF